MVFMHYALFLFIEYRTNKKRKPLAKIIIAYYYKHNIINSIK